MSEFEIVTSKKIKQKLRNVQICPARTRVEDNDKATKTFFSLDKATYNELRNGTPFDIVERKNHPKHGKITTPYSFVSPYEEPLT